MGVAGNYEKKKLISFGFELSSLTNLRFIATILSKNCESFKLNFICNILRIFNS